VRGAAVVIALALLNAALHAQTVALEYQVKAAYLLNFTRFVQWPPAAATGPLLLCVAGRNPFGTVLENMVRDETVNGRPVMARVILEPDGACDVVFVPRGAATDAYLRAARGAPVLTVGEEPDFIVRGGIIAFRIEGSNVRFSINPDRADQAQLRISSRLLQLARIERPETR
jgi:hypothetical protein